MMAGEQTYYEELGVARTATKAEIKQRYHVLALSLHPDTPGGSEAAFVRLSEAYSCLSNALTRREYDEKLDRPSQPEASTAYTTPEPPVYSATASVRRKTSNDTAARRRRSVFARFVGVMIFGLILLGGRALYLMTEASNSVPAPKTVQQTATSPGITNVVPSTDSSDSNSNSANSNADSSDSSNDSSSSDNADSTQSQPQHVVPQQDSSSAPSYQGNGHFGGASSTTQQSNSSST